MSESTAEWSITLDEFADRVLKPAMLRMFGLPDTIEGRAALDAIATAALLDD